MFTCSVQVYWFHHFIEQTRTKFNFWIWDCSPPIFQQNSLCGCYWTFDFSINIPEFLSLGKVQNNSPRQRGESWKIWWGKYKKNRLPSELWNEKLFAKLIFVQRIKLIGWGVFLFCFWWSHIINMGECDRIFFAYTNPFLCINGKGIRYLYTLYLLMLSTIHSSVINTYTYICIYKIFFIDQYVVYYLYV